VDDDGEDGQRKAIEVLRRGVAEDSIPVPPLALVELASAVTRPSSLVNPFL
jgi:hypothetical protein